MPAGCTLACTLVEPDSARNGESERLREVTHKVGITFFVGNQYACRGHIHLQSSDERVGTLTDCIGKSPLDSYSAPWPFNEVYGLAGRCERRTRYGRGIEKSIGLVPWAHRHVIELLFRLLESVLVSRFEHGRSRNAELILLHSHLAAYLLPKIFTPYSIPVPFRIAATSKKQQRQSHVAQQ